MNFLRYMQIVAGCKPEGWYTRMDLDMAGRLLNLDGIEAFGGVRPSDEESFEFVPFKMEHTESCGTPAFMEALWTREIFKALEELPVTPKPEYKHCFGGIPMPIKNWMDCAYDEIRIRTLGAVKPDQVRFVMSPDTIEQLAWATEVVAYFRGWESERKLAGRTIRENLGSHKAKLYGYPVVEESQQDIPLGTVFVLSRPGDGVGVDGAPSFCSACMFVKPELKSVGELLEREITDWAICFTSPISTIKLEGVV